MARKFEKEVNLDEKAKLYKGFKKVGGKIVPVEEWESVRQQEKLKQYEESKKHEEETRRKQEEIIKKKRLARAKAVEKMEKQKQEEAERKKQKTSSGTSKTPASKSSGSGSKTIKTVGVPFSFDVWAAKWRCRFAGIFRILDIKFTTNFLDLTIKRIAGYLQNCQKILVSTLHQDKTFTEKIQEKLNSIGRPYYFELVYRFDNIYEEELFSAILEAKTWKKQVQRARHPFIQLYKKLAVLKKYTPVLKQALKTSLHIEGRFKKLNQDVVDSNYNYLDGIVNKIFYDYYPKLERLIDYYYQLAKQIDPKLTMKKFLNYQKSEIMGYYTQLWREQKEYEEKRKRIEEAQKLRSQKEEKTKNVSERIAESEFDQQLRCGLGIIYHNVDFNRMLNALRESRDPMGIFDLNDKAFLIFTLLEFFYRHYSFIFLSNQVDFNMYYGDEGAKLDVRSQMKDLYFKMNSIYQRIREYLRIIQQIKKITQNYQIELDERFPEVKKILNQRWDLLRIINYETRKSMNTFSKIFDMILKDYAGENKLLRNPHDMIDSTTIKENGEKANSVKVTDIIREALCVTQAVEFLLTEGDLTTASYLLKEPQYLRIETPMSEIHKKQKDEIKREEKTYQQKEQEVEQKKRKGEQPEPIPSSAESSQQNQDQNKQDSDLEESLSDQEEINNDSD